jgi:hypothetical protein
MRINSGGYVGINVTSPGSIYRLNVNGTGLFQNGLVVNGSLSSIAMNISSQGSYLLSMTNSSPGVTGQNKYMRIGTTGTLEWVNSAGSSVIMSLTDAGVLTAAGGINIGTNLYVAGRVTSPLSIYFDNPSVSPHITLDVPSVQYRYTNYSTNGSPRWQFGVDNGAETGSNAGSNLFINSINDAGAYLDTPFRITRSNGRSYFSTEITVSNYGANAGQLRMVGGNYGAFWRNDGTNIYLLFTNIDDQYGTWNALRPFQANLSTGAVSIGNGLNVYDGGISTTWASNTATGAIYFGNTGTKYVNYDGTNFNMTGGGLGLGGDLTASRPSSVGTGAIYLGNSGTRYLYYDGSDYILNGAGLQVSGEITAYSSDQRLKSNIVPITDAVGKVSALNGVTFDWNERARELDFNPSNTRDVGVLAQDVERVLPEAVRIAPFDRNSDGTSKSGENYLTVQYEKLTALLIEAVKELNERIVALESEIRELRS